jgi:hypothetical protein
VQRATVNQYRWRAKRQFDRNYSYTPGELDVHETLMEHVGMLPVLATYFHPFVEEKVDLGKALTLLAIHDIGELIDGDANVFIKTAHHSDREREAALSLLHEQYHELYDEYDKLETNEALFAKSVDKIAPDIYDVITDPEVTRLRLKEYAAMEAGEIAAKVEGKKSPYMQWSTFFASFHKELIMDLKSIFPEE